MTTSETAGSEASIVVESRDDLVAYLEQGCKPPAAWRIGAEHEKFAFDLKTLRRLPYSGDGPCIRSVLEFLVAEGWSPIQERGVLIGAVDPTGAALSLEPGGQVELSGAPLPTLHDTCAEVNCHLEMMRRAGAEIGAGMIGVGFDPLWRREEVPWMPKQRYAIMRAWMPQRGTLGLDMMLRTCTVQVNLDFESETDMRRKMRVGMALQPLATALFACSPFREGRPNGWLSWRSQCWTDTDLDRCGLLGFALEDGFGFERWVDYALDVPMYFVHRGDDYLNVAGRSFRDFMEGRLPELPGQRPTIADWTDHLSTAFPEVRLKRFLEMRGADAGPWRALCALPAFWTGLLYDRRALDEAEALTAEWTLADLEALRTEGARQGLQATIRRQSLQAVARTALEIARGGLERRDRRNALGHTEAVFLDPLHRIVESGETLAETFLKAYHGPWAGDVTRLYSDYCY